MSAPATLSAHGTDIPVMGFGTSGLGKDAAELVAIALRLGYRHIDTARRYGTERGVGDGIRASGLPREDIFLTTKAPMRTCVPPTSRVRWRRASASCRSIMSISC
jgi:diketogulonate reductase-like aldo/keto reductase